MPQLIIEQPGIPPMTVPMSGKDIHLGRAEDNDVVLVADEVSRHHAKLRHHGEEYLLIDLNSLNGTYVNRQRITQRVLSHLDEIWFGAKCRLVFRDDTSLGRTPAADQHESTVIQGIDRIRAELDRAGSNLTMIGKRGRTPMAPTETPAAQPSPADLMVMSQAYRRLDALYRTSKLISSDFDLSKRLGAVLDTTVEVLEAERGFILLRDEQTGGLQVSVARAMGQDLHAASPSMGIAGKAAIDGDPVLLTDARNDAQFGTRESIVQQQIVSAMCAPLKIEDRILGSIYVDTRKVGQAFNEQDLELFMSLAAQSAMAIENVHLYRQMVEAEKKRANLGRFLSPSIVEQIMREDASLELGGAKSTVTTMFCDIRGFTPMAERLAPGVLVDMLNQHFTAMTEIVFQHQGTLDKYIGDEIMAVFGAPIPTPEDAERATRAALAMQARNGELNQERADADRLTFELGIGIHSGEVIAGYVGSPDRMDFTVVGDRVNTARRLCSLAGPGQVVIGDTTYEVVKDKVKAKAIGTCLLRGKEERVHAFEILGLKD